MRGGVMRGVISGMMTTAVLLVGCGREEVSPTSGAVEGTQVVVTETVTKTSTVEAQGTPATSFMPTATPTGTPDVPLSGDGPWVIFQGRSETQERQGIWAMNLDGSGITQVTDPAILVSQYKISPDGKYLAFTTSSVDYGGADSALNVMLLPNGPLVVTIPLIASDIILDSVDESATYLIPMLVGDAAWSPDAETLAFIGALDGPSADVYTYSMTNGDVRRLTTGDTQAMDVNWSPDGAWVVHRSVSFVDGDERGVWAAKADGSGSAFLYDDNHRHLEILAWIGGDTFVSFQGRMGPAPAGGGGIGDCEVTPGMLRTTNLTSGESNLLWPGPFADAAYSPEDQTILLVTSTDSAFCSQNSPLYLELDNVDHREGIFLLSTVNSNAQWIQESEARFADWSSEVDLFWVHTGDEWLTYDGAGRQMKLMDGLPDRQVDISPDAQWWAWHWQPEPGSRSFWEGQFNEHDGLWIGAYGQLPQRMTGLEFRASVWTPDGQSLLLFREDGIFRAVAPDFQVVRIKPFSIWSTDIALVGQR
jgi:dipeptidyl aminopeptidase/acylaminoacyl peptidase